MLAPRGWAVLAWPEAGEAIVQWRSGKVARGSESERGAAQDPDRSHRESVRRARTQLRRYIVGNGLKYLWTLTYAPEHLPDDRDGVWRDVAAFRRKLYRLLGRDLPLAAAIEEGSESGRLHVHFLVGERLAHSVVEEAWGRGWVWVEPPPKVRGAGRRERLRIAASYLTKYVGKDFGDQGEAGTGAGAAGDRPGRLNRKRYSVTTGYRPRRSQSLAKDLVAAWKAASEAVGGQVVAVWSSDALGDDWCGPPTVALRYD